MLAGFGRPVPGGRRHLAGIVAALVALALLVSVVELVRPQPSLLADTAFSAAAPALCARASSANAVSVIHPSGGPGSGGPRSQGPVSGLGSPAPAAMTAAANRVDRLASRLSALPSAARAQTPIRNWLARLHTWASDERAYADALARPGSPGATKLAASAGVQGRLADHFADSHGLSPCDVRALASDAGVSQ